MKTLKHPLNMSFTKRIVYSYAALLSVLSIFILINPVLAQENESDTNNPKVHIDIKKQFGLNPIHSLQHFHFRNSPHCDSTNISYFNFKDLHDYFDGDFDIDKYLPDDDFFEKYMPDEELMEQFSEQQENFIKRYNDYIEEHQKLIDKYFRTPYYKKDSIPEAKTNKYIPPHNALCKTY